MNLKTCPYCSAHDPSADSRTHIVKVGFFRRKSDCRLIQRYRCTRCLKKFSNATGHPAFGQNKRQFNFKLMKLLVSGVSLRRSAKILNLNRNTIDRKFRFLGAQASIELLESNLKHPQAQEVVFDDQETFEHTKCKPLSITLAVQAGTRRILGFEVSKMPAKGKLVHLARRKYGIRKDERSVGRAKLFQTLQALVKPTALFKSDQNPHYPKDLRKAFPHCTHETHKGLRGSITGQGELKKTRFDPLFALNHTCAMTRANMNRLFRRTWCTTKVPARLADHFAIYAVYHNLYLI
jgi:transposase-like protein